MGQTGCLHAPRSRIRREVVISTRRHLQYAAGFLDLGMIPDAARELDAIVRADRDTPEVLTVRIDLHMHAKQWKPVCTVAAKLVSAEPGNDKGWISWAFALRELGRIEKARQVLIEALPLHEKTCDVLHYNLACYECLLGNLPEALDYLSVAMQRDQHWKAEAIDDPDLEALWPEIAKMKG